MGLQVAAVKFHGPPVLPLRDGLSGEFDDGGRVAAIGDRGELYGPAEHRDDGASRRESPGMQSHPRTHPAAPRIVTPEVTFRRLGGRRSVLRGEGEATFDHRGEAAVDGRVEPADGAGTGPLSLQQ